MTLKIWSALAVCVLIAIMMGSRMHEDEERQLEVSVREASVAFRDSIDEIHAERGHWPDFRTEPFHQHGDPLLADFPMNPLNGLSTVLSVSEQLPGPVVMPNGSRRSGGSTARPPGRSR